MPVPVPLPLPAPQHAPAPRPARIPPVRCILAWILRDVSDDVMPWASGALVISTSPLAAEGVRCVSYESLSGRTIVRRSPKTLYEHRRAPW